MRGALAAHDVQEWYSMVLESEETQDNESGLPIGERSSFFWSEPCLVECAYFKNTDWVSVNVDPTKELEEKER